MSHWLKSFLHVSKISWAFKTLQSHTTCVFSAWIDALMFKVQRNELVFTKMVTHTLSEMTDSFVTLITGCSKCMFTTNYLLNIEAETKHMKNIHYIHKYRVVYATVSCIMSKHAFRLSVQR